VTGYPAASRCHGRSGPHGEGIELNWYTTKIADAATLDVLLAKLGAQVDAARREGTLDDTAQVYAFTLDDAVRLYVNEAARAGLAVIRSLALLPSPAPTPAEMQRALIGRATAA
jgi:hypothetical protein